MIGIDMDINNCVQEWDNLLPVKIVDSTSYVSCSGSLKTGTFEWHAALALIGSIYDTPVESAIFPIFCLKGPLSLISNVTRKKFSHDENQYSFT